MPDTLTHNEVLQENYAARQSWERACDAAEKKAKRIDNLFAEIIAACKDAAATEPDFHCEFDKLGDALDDCRHDWLTGGVYAEIKLMRENG